MFQYLILCIITILCGKGILHIIRIQIPSPLYIYLSPVITLSFWTIFLAWGILLKYPIQEFCYFGWFLTAVFSLIGILRISFIENTFKIFVRKNATEKITLRSVSIISKKNRNIYLLNLFLIIYILLLPALVLLPYFSYNILNYGGSNHPDYWSYIAYGQYLWENSRGAEGGLIPLYQYAAHLADTRFITAAILAFLSPFMGHAGDTQAAMNVFLAWIFFVLSSSCVFYAKIKRIDSYIPFYLLLVLFSSLFMEMIGVSNLDNAIVLSFLPIYAGVAHLIHAPKSRWIFVLSLLSAAVIYCYIEMAPIIFACVFIIFLHSSQAINKKNIWINVFLSILIICAVTFLLCLPFIKVGFNFFLHQFFLFKEINNNLLPGESWMMIYGGQYFIVNDLLSNIIGIVIMSFIFYGYIILWKEKEIGLLLTGVLLISGSAYMIYYQHYEYGGYKLLLLAWWLSAYAMTKAVMSMMKYNKYNFIFIILCIFGTAYFNSIYTFQNRIANTVTIKDIRPIRELSSINKVINDMAIKVSIDQDVYNQWAVYFLREVPIKLQMYRGIMAAPHLIPFMNRSKNINQKKILYELTDNNHKIGSDKLVWSSGPYYLYKIN